MESEEEKTRTEKKPTNALEHKKTDVWGKRRDALRRCSEGEKNRPGNMAAYTCNNGTRAQTRTHASQWLMLPILNITPQNSLLSRRLHNLHIPPPPLHPPRALHPTCSEACWHTWLRDSAVLFLMMNYASAAVSLKNAITTVIRQMGLFCLAYAVHLLNGVE